MRAHRRPFLPSHGRHPLLTRHAGQVLRSQAAIERKLLAPALYRDTKPAEMQIIEGHEGHYTLSDSQACAWKGRCSCSTAVGVGLLQGSPNRLDLLDIARLPILVDRRFGRAVKAQDREEAFARYRRQPIGCFAFWWTRA